MIPKTVRRLLAFPECLRGAGETQREGQCFEGVLQCVRAAFLPAFRAVREPDEFPDFPEFSQNLTASGQIVCLLSIAVMI